MRSREEEEKRSNAGRKGKARNSRREGRHLVQYERHWMEEQKTGRRRSKYMHFEGARRREVKLHKQATMKKKKEEKLVWAGSRWMTVPTLTGSGCVDSI